MNKFLAESKHKRDTIEKWSCILIHISFSSVPFLNFLSMNHCILELWFQSILAHSKNLNVINQVLMFFYSKNILNFYFAMQNARMMCFKKKSAS